MERSYNVTTSLYGTYYTNPSPKWHEDIWQSACVLKKRKYLDFSRTIRYRICTDSDPREHKTASWVEIYEGQIINGVWAQAHPHLWLFSGTWQNPYIDSSACGMEVMKVGENCQVEPPEPPHFHLWPRQYIRNNAAMGVLQTVTIREFYMGVIVHITSLFNYLP